MDRRTFLLASAILGAKAAAGPIGCAARAITKPKSAFTPVDIKLVPFQDYNPGSATKELTLQDGMLMEYLTVPYSAENLELCVSGNPALVELIEKKGAFKIKDRNRLRNLVLREAQKIGISEEEIKNLSVHDAIMLSGKLVAERLSYHKKMLNQDRFKTTEEGERIDNLAIDELFEEGLGVCRNYAVVNIAVFDVIKDINPRLRNTHMRWNDPGMYMLSHFPHAWNMVSTVVENNNGLDLLVTYVDPTWLDTKNRTAFADGKKQDNLSDEDAYNALDEDHCGPLLVPVYSEWAGVYKALASELNDPRVIHWDGKLVWRNPKFEIKPFEAYHDANEYYRRKAVETYIHICEKTLDVSEKKPEDFKLVDTFFFEALKNASDMSKDNNYHDQIQVLKQIYQRAKILKPKLVIK